MEGIVYVSGDAQSRGSWCGGGGTAEAPQSQSPWCGGDGDSPSRGSLWEGCVIVGAIYSIPKIRYWVGGSGSLFCSTVSIGRRCSADRNMIG